MIYYVIACKGWTAISFSYYGALTLAMRMAKHKGATATVRLSCEKTARYRAYPDGTLERREDYCTCDFCHLCYHIGETVTCPKRPTEWSVWEEWGIYH